MKYILEITPHDSDSHIIYKQVEFENIRIGRGYSNNIILNDPYIDAEHIEIFRDGVDLFVEDLGSVNGVKVNGNRRAMSKLSAGDIIIVGTTKIKILSPAMEVAPAVKIIDKRFILTWIEKSSSAWISVLLLLGLMRIWTYTELWPRKEQSLIELTIVASATVLVLIWASIWSIASRFTRYKANFRCHVTIFSFYLIFSIFAWYGRSYIMFFNNEGWLAYIFNYAVSFAMFTVLIYASLTYTSNMIDRKNMLFAAIFSLSIIVGMISIDYISRSKFSLSPNYSASMEPYFVSLIKAEAIDDFMNGNKSLFEAKALTKLQK